MKKLFPTLMISLCLLSACVNFQQQDQANTNAADNFEWTDSLKDQAKTEVRQMAAQVIENAAKLNYEEAAKPYLNSPDFVVINPDNSIDNYDDFMKKGKETFAQLDRYDQRTKNELFRFLDEKRILYTWIGETEVGMKSGDQMKFETYVGTMLLERIDGEWRIVYAHESASQPIVISAEADSTAT